MDHPRREKANTATAYADAKTSIPWKEIAALWMPYITPRWRRRVKKTRSMWGRLRTSREGTAEEGHTVSFRDSDKKHNTALSTHVCVSGRENWIRNNFETLPVVNKHDVTRDFTRRNEAWQVGQAPVYQELDKWKDPWNLGCFKFLQVCGFIYKKKTGKEYYLLLMTSC